jgi:hypothetical protein
LASSRLPPAESLRIIGSSYFPMALPTTEHRQIEGWATVKGEVDSLLEEDNARCAAIRAISEAPDSRGAAWFVADSALEGAGFELLL